MDELKNLLEILYFLSGPVMAIFIFYGLRQLKISKDSIIVSAKRDSFKLAAEQCKYYMERIIPLLN